MSDFLEKRRQIEKKKGNDVFVLLSLLLANMADNGKTDEPCASQSIAPFEAA